MLEQQLVNALSLGCVYALFALGFTLVFGILGVINLSHGAVFMLGAYAALQVVNHFELPLWAALAVGFVVSGVAGLIIDVLLLRPLRRRNAPHLIPMIATIGAGIAINNAMQGVFGAENMRFPSGLVSDASLDLGGIHLTPLELSIIVLSFVLMAALMLLLKRTQLGRALRAIAESPKAAALLGINVEGLFLLTSFAGRDLYRCEEISYLPQFDAQGHVAGVHAVTLDITERKKQELRLRALTTTDHLTGLLNRAGFDERLLAALDQARVTDTVGALLLLDLDGFKAVNDTHGHSVGDALLRAFAQRLARAVRPYDGVARFGGDEFAVVLEQLSQPEDAKTVARTVLAACNKPFRLGEITVQIGTSIGLAGFDSRTLAQSAVFEAADEALYEAKSRGKGLFVSADELSAG